MAMARIGLIDVDGKLPNLALMKISRYHKSLGDTVEWHDGLSAYDVVYMAKIFSFTPDYGYYVCADKVVRGGTGYDLSVKLPAEIDRLQPDYSIYPQVDGRTAYGFLTRGCPNKCQWCVVPRKEGGVAPYMDIEEIAVDGRDRITLMDNNVLASDFGISQIEKIAGMKLRVDFNQGLDARLVSDEVAALLARVPWLHYIRFGCDTPRQIADVERAIKRIDCHGYTGSYFLYCMLIGDIAECYERVSRWKRRPDGRRIIPYSQPYRNPDTAHSDIPQWQKDMTRWVNKKQLFKSCDFMDFSPRKGFRCGEYFKHPLKQF